MIGLAFIMLIVLCIIGTKAFVTSSDTVKVPFILKYIFYSCIILAAIQFILFMVNVINCSQIAIVFSLTIYGIINIHLFFLWLFRLYITFNESVFAKSILFFSATIIVFALFLSFAIASFILYLLDFAAFGRILIILSVFGYVIMSIWLMTVFARYLYIIYINDK